MTSSPNKLTIITPCSRPENLPRLKDSIDFSLASQWIIAHDARKRETTPVFDHPQVKEVQVQTPGFSGNTQRNLGLDFIKEGYVYHLDDDNLVHPNFWNIFRMFSEGKIYTFRMEGHPNPQQLDPQHPEPNTIDTAMFCFEKQLAAGLRWLPHLYDADGIFIESLIRKHPDRHVFIDEPAAYYNRLNSAQGNNPRKTSAIEIARIIKANEDCYHEEIREVASFLLEQPEGEDLDYPFSYHQARFLSQRFSKSDELTVKKNYVWGTGEKGRNDLEFLNEFSIKIHGFIDGAGKLVGKTLNEIPVLRPEEVLEKGDSHIFISSMYFNAIENELRSWGKKQGVDWTTLF